VIISVWTSWTADINTALDFAKGPLGNTPGVILSKRFKIGVNAIPNVFYRNENTRKRVVNFGPVIRANVQYIKPQLLCK
jgi:hypothetical protein